MTEVSNLSIMRLDRKSSIEMEPQTLNFRQIKSARDAALYVVKTRTMEEATQIFTEGMTPIENTGKKNKSGITANEYLEGYEGGGFALPTYNYHQFGLATLRDILTAPF